jgi:hypothetical protein
MQREQQLLAIFVYVDDLLAALRRLKEMQCSIRTVFSPLRLREVQEILGAKPSIVRLITLVGGIAGGLGFVGLAVYAHLSFKLITSGKPVLPWIAWVIVCFEGTILLSVTFSVVAWILKGRLPRVRLATGYDSRFSNDRFGILVDMAGADREEIIQLLEKAGAEEVRDVTT